MVQEPTPAQVVERLCSDQRRRWQQGERVPAETYFREQPAFFDSQPACAIELIFNEYLLQQETGEAVAPPDYLRRFPQFAAQLGPLFEVDQEIAQGNWFGSRPSPAGPSTTWPPTTSVAGPAIPGYEILGELGRGGMGVVYQARQLAANRLVALKVIPGGALAGPEELARFRIEAKALARMQHPGIVQIFEVGAWQDQPYFAMELVDGGSLEKKLAGTPQPARSAAQLVETLARALAAVHQRGILHRDLKPANVLLTADGTPKVTDFGLAKLLVEAGPTLTHSGEILGTPSYMAPEQAAGQSRAVGPATDVYALGAILYELLTGRPPFKAETLQETLLLVMGQDPVPPSRFQPKLPRDVVTICLKCLEKEPAKRYVSAVDLAEDLQSFLLGKPIRARPVGRLGHLWRWCRRQPVLATLSAALVVVCLGGSALVAWQVQRAEAERLAGRRFAQSFEAMEMYFTGVRESEQFQLLPRGYPLRKQLLEGALAFYQKFSRQAEEFRDDPGLRAKLARAHLRVAEMAEEVNPDPKEAVASYQEAIAILTNLQRDQPGVVEIQRDLGQAYRYLGTFQRSQHFLKDSQRSLGEARSLLERLAKTHPGDRAIQLELAEAYNSLGALQIDRKELKEALGYFRASLDIYEKLDGPDHADPKIRRLRARAYGNLGVVWERLPEGMAQALACYNQARELREKIVRDTPLSPLAQMELASSYYNLGNYYNTAGQLTQALRSFEQALPLRRKLADANPTIPYFQVALALVHNDMGSISADLPGPSDRALEAFRHARAILNKVPGDRFRIALALAWNNTGDLRREIGQPREAIAAHEEARQILTPLADKHREITDYARDLARTYHLIGRAEFERGRLPEALTAHEEARRRQRRLVDAKPQVTLYAQHLAETDRCLGRVYHALGGPREALQALHQARAGLQKLLHQAPSFESRLELARTWNEFAFLSRDDSKTADAVTQAGKALPLLKSLTRDQPGNREVRDEMARTLYLLGLLHQDQGEAKVAQDYYRQAIEVQDALRGDFPDIVNYRHQAGLIWLAWADSWVREDAAETALAAYHRAVSYLGNTLDKGPQVPRYRKDLSQAYRQLARVERALHRLGEAAVTAVQDQQLWPDNPGELFQAARQLARCIPLVGKGKTQLNRHEKDEQREYGDRVMEALRQAIGQGFKDVRQLRGDDFVPLRGRADFEELLNNFAKSGG
jgi:tetratricopeptide (TPR) repeat protein